MRRPISLKIFSIALGMLLLMAIVTAVSTYHLRAVNNEVRALSEYDIPFEHSMSRVSVAQRSQIVHLEHLLLLEGMAKRDPRAIESELALFQARGRAIYAEVEQAILLAESGKKSGSVQLDPVEIALLAKELPDILLVQDRLEQKLLRYTGEVRRGDARALNVLLEAITEERAHADKEVQDVTLELQKFTKDAAARAARLEFEAFRTGWGITLGAGILGLLVAALITRNLVRPVRELLLGTRAIENGDLSVNVRVTSADEIATLTDSFNHMVGELRHKERIKETFGKYVDPRIVEGLLGDARFEQGGEKRVMTVFFSDLEGFTAFGEQLTPDRIVRFLNRYFTLMSEPIRARRGIIDKYIGDAIMAFWGPPFSGEAEHAGAACLAALDQLALLGTLQAELPDLLGLRKGLPQVRFRVGIATGEVTVGNIGSESARGYTVIGDTVNLASRLEGANKEYGTQILVTRATHQEALADVETREIDLIRVIGRQEPVAVFELLAAKGGLTPARVALRDEFESGLAAYRRLELARAARHFDACLALDPGDKPAALFLSRLGLLRDNPQAAGWDGVWSLSRK